MRSCKPNDAYFREITERLGVKLIPHRMRPSFVPDYEGALSRVEAVLAGVT